MDKDIPTILILKKLAKGLDRTIFDIIDEQLGRKRINAFIRKFVRFIRKILIFKIKYHIINDFLEKLYLIFYKLCDKIIS